MKLAITGGTGFVGSHLIEAALAAGHSLKALARRDQPPRDTVEWVAGSLEDPGSLDRLVSGCESVIHAAGIINAPDAAAFEDGNVEGTRAMLDAAANAGGRRFVHVSSLAAREPTLSLYGASKARSEALVEQSGLDWAIVRSPAVYGPGDKETLELFRMAKLGLMLMPPSGRLSLIHAADLARLLLALAAPGAPSASLVEPDDGKPGGWTHRQFGQALGVTVGKSPLILSAPSFLLRLGARADQLLRGPGAKLTPDRAAYFSHRDWVVEPGRAAPRDLWQPQIPTAEGLADTANWYRRKGWL
ncbi:MAG TPA: NAD-dependent epimerase/dehydratase family protein [Sphingomicrobium sp.]|nr:NAD-dependent epimerase/dehydratase family protein [Sphingomicrobium sp.]